LKLLEHRGEKENDNLKNMKKNQGEVQKKKVRERKLVREPHQEKNRPNLFGPKKEGGIQLK